MAFLTDIFVSVLSSLPKPLMRRFASRYIAGETTAEALKSLAKFNAMGFPGVLDILGEDEGGGDPATSVRHAQEAMAQYCQAASDLAASGHDAYISAKPTHFGLHASEELCFDLYDALCLHCAKLGLFMRVEMEDHPTTDATLRIFKRLLIAHDNVGIVIQSRLFRTLNDIDDLIAMTPANRRLHVRMVKGIYIEPAEVAHTEYMPIADAFVECTETLWRAGARVSLATHDDLMAPRLDALRLALKLDSDAYEYEVLMGVRPKLWRAWQAAGHPVRVYVPYGPDWHAYSMRRLKKNPKLLQQMAFGFLTR